METLLRMVQRAGDLGLLFVELSGSGLTAAGEGGVSKDGARARTLGLRALGLTPACCRCIIGSQVGVPEPALLLIPEATSSRRLPR